MIADRCRRRQRNSMAQKVTSEKLQKLTFMLGQTVAALRVNEILTCRLLRWAATQSDDPRFMEVIFEATKNELRSSGKADGSTATAKVAEEALEFSTNWRPGSVRARHAKGSPAKRKAFRLSNAISFRPLPPRRTAVPTTPKTSAAVSAHRRAAPIGAYAAPFSPALPARCRGPRGT